MGRNVRLGLLACAGLSTLALAATASAEKLGVSSTPVSGVVIHYSQPSGSPAPAKVTIYPNPSYLAGTQVQNFSQPPGTTIGTVSAKAIAGALGGATLPLTGSLIVKGAGDTYLSNGSPVPLATAATACTGTPTHTTFWVAQLTAAGQTLEVPIFVDAVPLTIPGADGTPAPNPEASATTGWGSAEIKLCLPSPDVPPPAGAAFGAHLFDAVLTIKGVWSGGSNEYRWRAIVIPYTAGTATADPTKAVEVQGLERRFGFVAARAKYSGLTATVTGTVTEAGASVAGVLAVKITGGTKAVRAKTDNTTGDFKATVKLRAKRAPLKVTATVPERDLGAAACSLTPAFAAALPTITCADTSVGGWTFSAKVRRAR